MAATPRVAPRRWPSRRARFRRSRAGAGKPPWRLVLGAILSAEIVIWTVRATDWFGWAPGSGAPGPSGTQEPNLNPYNESIQEVVASIDYTTNASGYFPALQGTDICGHCPARPFTDYNVSPAVAGFWFYFNVTNDAPDWEWISNFSIATSGANPELFGPGFVACCYPDYYQSETNQPLFPPNATWGFAAFVQATSIPDVGPGGFVLYFNVTSP
jgi:hypothetical protein